MNKIKDFGEAAKRELMMDRQTFEMARRRSHDTMEEKIPWTPPRPLTLTGSLVTPGAESTEKLTQRDREMGILQEIFLSKERYMVELCNFLCFSKIKHLKNNKQMAASWYFCFSLKNYDCEKFPSQSLLLLGSILSLHNMCS